METLVIAFFIVVLCLVLLFCSACGIGGQPSGNEPSDENITYQTAGTSLSSDVPQSETLSDVPSDGSTTDSADSNAESTTAGVPSTTAPVETSSESTTAQPTETATDAPTSPPEPSSNSAGANAEFKQRIDNASESSISFGGKLYPTGSDFNTELTALEYDGNPVTFNMDIYNGGFEFEIGVMIYVNGILQQFNADMNGRTYTNQKVCSVNLVKHTDHIFNISFVPNTGKAGAVSDLVICVMPFSSYVKTDSGYTNGTNTINEPLLSGYHNLHTYDVPLTMTTDAPSVEPVASGWSGASTSSYPTNLRKMLSNDSSMDWQNTRNVLIYTDFNDTIDSKGEFVILGNIQEFQNI